MPQGMFLDCHLYLKVENSLGFGIWILPLIFERLKINI
jgi:hypothetical protein